MCHAPPRNVSCPLPPGVCDVRRPLGVPRRHHLSRFPRHVSQRVRPPRSVTCPLHNCHGYRSWRGSSTDCMNFVLRSRTTVCAKPAILRPPCDLPAQLGRFRDNLMGVKYCSTSVGKLFVDPLCACLVRGSLLGARSLALHLFPCPGWPVPAQTQSWPLQRMWRIFRMASWARHVPLWIRPCRCWCSCNPPGLQPSRHASPMS